MDEFTKRYGTFFQRFAKPIATLSLIGAAIGTYLGINAYNNAVKQGEVEKPGIEQKVKPREEERKPTDFRKLGLEYAARDVQGVKVVEFDLPILEDDKGNLYASWDDAFNLYQKAKKEFGLEETVFGALRSGEVETFPNKIEPEYIGEGNIPVRDGFFYRRNFKVLNGKRVVPLERVNEQDIMRKVLEEARVLNVKLYLSENKG